MWVDDDFKFTKDTDLRHFLDFLETNPYFDLMAGNLDNYDVRSLGRTWGSYSTIERDENNRCFVHTSGWRDSYLNEKYRVSWNI